MPATPRQRGKKATPAGAAPIVLVETPPNLNPEPTTPIQPADYAAAFRDELREAVGDGMNPGPLMGRDVSRSRRPNHVLRLGRGVLYTPSSLLRFQRFCSRRPQEAGRRWMDRNLSHVAYLSKRFCSPDMRISQRRSLGFLSTRSEVDREIPITPIGVDTVNHQR